MARGQPEGVYTPSALAAVSLEELVRQLAREFDSVANALNLGLLQRVNFYHVEPGKPREGDIVGADGTDWNPGGGKGVYAYYSSAWNKLG